MSGRRFSNSNNPRFACTESIVLLPFGRRSYLPAMIEAWAGEEVALDETTDRLVYRLQGLEPPATLVYSGMGGPAAANALEMAAAFGGRRVVLFGACGGVDPALEVGDLLVAHGAVRGEGTSPYYAPREYPAICDPELTGELWRAATARPGVGVRRGVVYTTDASYRQGSEIYERFAGLVVGVDCECAAAAVTAARLGLSLGALFFCTDNVNLPEDRDRSYRGLADLRVRRGFREGTAAVAEALSRAARLA